MKPADKEKTAFATTLGLYQFTVMSFGLVNAPSSFERLMENVLRGLQWVECLLYMDDIIVPSKSVEEGVSRLEHILQRLRQANLKCKPSKCILFQKKVKFLGHMVSECGVSTDPDKIASVKDWSQPHNSKDVKSFLGLCSYYRRFVPDFAKIARPLNKLAEKSNKFEWTDECTKAFTNLKTALTTSPVLGYPVPNAKYILDTDASNFATGAVLSQVQDEKEIVIAYYSKTLNIHEQRYCVTRKELLAVVHALKAFHHYIYGQHVLLRTDNAAVSWMKNLKQPTGQVARWLELLGTYNLSIKHRPGLQHRNADALSRAPCTKCARQQNINEHADDHESPCCNNSSSLHPSITNVFNTQFLDTEDTIITRAVTRSQSLPSKVFKYNSATLLNWSSDDIKEQQTADVSLQVIMNSLEQSDSRPNWSTVSGVSSVAKTLWRMWDRLSLQEGILFRTWHNDNNTSFKQIIVPVQCRKDVFNLCHNIPSAAHLGADKTLPKAQQTFYWPGMKRDIERFCAQCDQCAARKPPKPCKSPLGAMPVNAPMERVAVDIFGPLPLSKQNNKYVLVVTDLFTKWTEAYALPNQEAETVCKAFVNNLVSRFGVPPHLHSDRGMQKVIISTAGSISGNQES